MKYFKKLICTVCMLLVALSLMATSTYAWFSMNDTVAVTGMSVKATGSGGLYFQIVAGDDLFNSDIMQVVAVAKNYDKKLYPTTVGSQINEDAVTPITGLETTEDLSKLKWAAAMSINAGSYQRWGNYVSITNAANEQDGLDGEGNVVVSKRNQYTLINKFRVRTNPKVGVGLAKDLVVNQVVIKEAEDNDFSKSMLTALRFLIVSATGTAVFDYTGNVIAGADDFIGTDSATIALGEIPDDDIGTEVYTYIYFDGDNENVFSNRLSTNRYEVSFRLEITAPVPILH